MEQLKHTPGPWRISWQTLKGGDYHGIYAHAELDFIGYEIATVNTYPTADPHADEQTGKANAKLIAAAPDLLEDLQMAYNLLKVIYGDSFNEWPQAVKIKGTIEKATK